MRFHILRFLFSATCLNVCVLLMGLWVPIRAGEPASTQMTRTVGSVYGKAISAADIDLKEPINPAIQFDSRDKPQWELMGRIMTAFGKPISDRFIKKQKIAATDDEIATFKKVSRKNNERHVRETEDQLAILKATLEAPDLSDKKRAELIKKQKMLEKSLPHFRDSASHDVPDDLARHFIVTWKTERELHRKYGGRVIFQQFGLEALDGRRLLFEEAEKNGDLKFDDAGVRHIFYYYFTNTKHTVIDEKLLERPSFFGTKDGTEEEGGD